MRGQRWGDGGEASPMFSRLPVRRLDLRSDTPPPDPGSWPATVPAVAHLLRAGGLELGPATVLVGENGSGKSTLVEAFAMAFGLNAEGGSTGARHRTHASESGLHAHLQVVRNAGASRWGFFLRAETMHGFFTYLDENPGPRDPDFHAMSHGESFREILQGNRLDDPGFYVLDEPESALSFTGQLALLARLRDIAATGASQVLLSTHSPVLAALPGARLLELGEWGMREAAWGDLELVDHYRRFLDAPARYLRYLD